MGVTGTCELPTNLVFPLQEQRVLLTTEPTLQPRRGNLGYEFFFTLTMKCLNMGTIIKDKFSELTVLGPSGLSAGFCLAHVGPCDGSYIMIIETCWGGRGHTTRLRA